MTQDSPEFGAWRAPADALPVLSDAFLKEFGNKQVDISTLQESPTAAAKIVERHYAGLANLSERRSGWPISFDGTPAAVSYGDLKEMEKLSDARIGLQHHYSQEDISAMESRDVGWAKIGGVGCGALAGGLVRMAVPAFGWRGAAVTTGLMALGAVTGYKVGESLGQSSFDRFAANSSYLSVEQAKYGDALGTAWQNSTKLVGGAGIVSGVVAMGVFNAPRVGVGLAVAGLVTYISSGLAYRFGYHSATREMAAEADLGRRVEQEWKAARH